MSSANDQPGREEYYARVAPVIGRGLAVRRIAVCNLAAVAGAAERLAGLSARRWALCDTQTLGIGHPLARMIGPHGHGKPASTAFAAMLAAHNGWEEDWDFARCADLSAGYSRFVAGLRAAMPDLLLGGGTAEQVLMQGWAASELGIPAVLIMILAGEPRSIVRVLLPDQHGIHAMLRRFDYPYLPDPSTDITSPDLLFSWLDANATAAALVSSLLLDGADTPGNSQRQLLQHGRTLVLQGRESWPWAINYVEPESLASIPVPGDMSIETKTEAGPVLVLGLGSLGSVAARDMVLAGLREIVLVDGDVVDPANPVRQFYSTAQVGQAKAEALARNLAVMLAPMESWSVAPLGVGDGMVLGWGDYRIGYLNRMADDELTPMLLETLRPAAALLATGTDADYSLAAALRERDIGHIAGRCYPRARYFEAVIVDGQVGPCFSCLRGHLYTGPRPGPTSEERLLYSQPPTDNAASSAMPATIVESGRAADVLARVALQLALPREARATWLQDLIAAEQTLLLGGNEASRVESITAGEAQNLVEWAYGIALPGQVATYGGAQIMGIGETRRCYECGRVSAVKYTV